MENFRFTVVFTGPTDDVEELCELLGAANADDGTPFCREGVTGAMFTTPAESLEAAIRSALGRLRSAGLTPKRVEMSPELIEV